MADTVQYRRVFIPKPYWQSLRYGPLRMPIVETNDPQPLIDDEVAFEPFEDHGYVEVEMKVVAEHPPGHPFPTP